MKSWARTCKRPPLLLKQGPMRGEQGATLVLVALVLVGLLGMAALAIDIGMLFTARTESQRTADSAALAGAGEYIEQYFLSSSNSDDAIRQEAKDYAAPNVVRNESTTVLDEDIEILHGEKKVRVWIRNTAERANAVPTWFARVLGIEEADVATMAAAKVTGASGGDCLLPVALPDEWIDNGDGMWNPSEDTYTPWPESGYTGYGMDDVGMRIQIKTAVNADNNPPMCQPTDVHDACNSFGDSSWRCWWLDDRPSQGGGGGVDELDPRIRACEGEGKEVGDYIWAASGAGNKQSLVQGAFKDLVDADPGITWDEANRCPTRSGEGCVFDSDRIRRIPLVDPNEVEPEGGANTRAKIASFAGVFVEKVSCSENVPHGGGPEGRWNVYVRLMGLTGSNPIDRDDTLLKTIQLVE